jgi:SAM-dependent methyltransferase
MGGKAGGAIAFTCNLCGAENRRAGGFDRETPSCGSCGSNVRMRSLARALSLELFGVNLIVPGFPRLKSLRGMGTSDSLQYADTLTAKFDYRNTFFDREPRFDLARPDEREFGRHDFVLSSEVLEHVAPPVKAAFRNAARLLKDSGVLLLTVPYSLEATTAERFPELHEWGIARVGERLALVNRKRSGEIEVFEDLVFHVGCESPAVEMREFSERDLRCLLEGAGFATIRVHAEEYPPYGIFHEEPCSLPVAARKGAFGLSADATRELVEHWRDAGEEMRRMGRSWWFRAGRKMGWC